MEDIGIDSAVEESSILQESLSLKAFLRVSKEERRDHLIASISPVSTPIKSPEKMMDPPDVTRSVTDTAKAYASEFYDVSENKSSMLSSSSSSSSSMRSRTNKVHFSSDHRDGNSGDSMNTYHKKFTLTYDPNTSVMNAPPSPPQNSDFFQDLSNDESKSPLNQRFTCVIYVKRVFFVR